MQTFQLELGGRHLVVETGKYAKQANGSVLIRYGETAVVVAATTSAAPREGIDFFPLTVDYEERMYSVGKIPGGFIKREGRPTETAILSARMIDRPIRPLFADGFRNDVHIVATVVSVDQDNTPDVIAMVGASCALSVSDIPFNGPIAGVRIGYINEQYIVNPTVKQMEESQLDLIVAGTKDAVLMVEAGANELSELVIQEGILFGHDVVKELIAFQETIVAAVGKPKREIKTYAPPADLDGAVRAYVTEAMKEAVANSDKLAREAKLDEVKAQAAAHFAEIYPENKKDVSYVLYNFL